MCTELVVNALLCVYECLSESELSIIVVCTYTCATLSVVRMHEE